MEVKLTELKPTELKPKYSVLGARGFLD